MEEMTRREFLFRSAAAGAAGAATLMTPAPAFAAASGSMGTMIDLTLCAGCGACTTACHAKNSDRYPQPVEDIPVNWPTGKYEDWSDLRDKTDGLTPYNWTYVETVEVDGRTVNIPRHCMHCDDPACANLCPFGAQDKTEHGAVVIDEHACLGGAKCKAVCPWGMPQRQAGVGVYMKLMPGVMGGGVMYKCDGCADLLARGESPACVTACPTGAMQHGDKDEMKARARDRAAELGGHVYGADENGGTSVFYVSEVPFEAIDEAISRKKEQLPERLHTTVPHMKPGVDNYLETASGLASTYAWAPMLGVAAAGVAAMKAFKGGSK